MNRRRERTDRIVRWLTGGLAGSVVVLVFVIFGTLLWYGLPSVTWEMVSSEPSGGYYFGKEGGILNAIVGSMWLAGGATILAVLLSLPLALVINVRFAGAVKRLAAIRFWLDVLWGVPSIVYGAFGFSLMLAVGAKTSLLAGMLTVAFMITPIMVRAMDEVLQTVPGGLLEASVSLGATPSETAVRVFMRQAAPGLVTALLLAFGRGIGDAASVLFTAGYTDHIPTSLAQPSATLPLAIFFQLTSPIPEVRERAYAAAVILTMLVLGISLLSRFLSSRMNSHAL